MRIDEKGQSLVEWAIILPMIIMLFIGMIDFGWAFGKQHSISQIAKELARSASIGETIADLQTEAFNMSGAVINPDTITYTEVSNTSVFTITATDGKEVIITFDESLTTREKGKKFKVLVEYTYEPFTPIVNNADIPLYSQYYTKAETMQSN
jgi:Flp pilus assembly protein TadG